MRTDVQQRIGRAWDAASVPGRGRNWWDVPELATHVDARVAVAGGALPGSAHSGVAAALEAALAKSGEEAAGLAISIGSGAGDKERRLLRAGLVSRFRLYDLSRIRIEAAGRLAQEEGLADRVDARCADAFAETHPGYDLVYWDHSLHHMMDVDAALAWSVSALRPGGLLLINDYVGPTRLQWPWSQTRIARQVLAEIEQATGERPRRLRPRTPLDRWRMKRRDPSEAPQSDLIQDACRRRCGGFELQPLGCALFNILGPHVAPLHRTDLAAPILIRRDGEAEAAGVSHFAFGIWRKPV